MRAALHPSDHLSRCSDSVFADRFSSVLSPSYLANIDRRISGPLDPVNVGYVNESFAGAFTYATTPHGNSNSGHNHGTQLTSEEKRQLLEYLKTL